MGAQESDARVIAELSALDKHAEASEVLSRVGDRGTEEFRRRVMEEVVEAGRMAEQHRRRLSKLAMVVGILAGIVWSGWTVWLVWMVWHIDPPILPTMAYSVACGAVGASMAWWVAK